eukprot:Amastigsp_a509787_137.p2 type:complete len:122 gc:universal Amastigsp_a509787_137:366-1(-)
MHERDQLERQRRERAPKNLDRVVAVVRDVARIRSEVREVVARVDATACHHLAFFLVELMSDVRKIDFREHAPLNKGIERVDPAECTRLRLVIQNKVIHGTGRLGRMTGAQRSREKSPCTLS